MPVIIFRFLLCGSSDNDAYIWRTDGCSSSPWVLKGHESEVTSVAWAPFDGEKVGATYGKFENVSSETK